MATKSAKVARRADAESRIRAAMKQLAEVTGVAPVAPPTFRVKDAEMVEVLEKESMADWMEAVVRFVSGDKTDAHPRLVLAALDGLTVDELRKEAANHEIDLGGVTRKADIIAVIRSALE